jgi:hypothetical protein
MPSSRFGDTVADELYAPVSRREGFSGGGHAVANPNSRRCYIDFKNAVAANKFLPLQRGWWFFTSSGPSVMTDARVEHRRDATASWRDGIVEQMAHDDGRLSHQPTREKKSEQRRQFDVKPRRAPPFTTAL